MNLEGIVSKRVASRYKSGSCVSWVRVGITRRGGRATYARRGDDGRLPSTGT